MVWCGRSCDVGWVKVGSCQVLSLGDLDFGCDLSMTLTLD